MSTDVQFKSFKVRIRGAQHWEATQRAAFIVGYRWGFGGATLLGTPREVLYFSENGKLSYADMAYADRRSQHIPWVEL